MVVDDNAQTLDEFLSHNLIATLLIYSKSGMLDQGAIEIDVGIFPCRPVTSGRRVDGCIYMYTEFCVLYPEKRVLCD